MKLHRENILYSRMEHFTETISQLGFADPIDIIFMQKDTGFEVTILSSSRVTLLRYTNGMHDPTIDRKVVNLLYDHNKNIGLAEFESGTKITAHPNGQGFVVAGKARNHYLIYFIENDDKKYQNQLYPIAALKISRNTQLTIFPETGFLIWQHTNLIKGRSLILGDCSSGTRLQENTTPFSCNSAIFYLEGNRALNIADKKAWLLDIKPRDIKNSTRTELKNLSDLLANHLPNDHPICNMTLSPNKEILAIFYGSFLLFVHCYDENLEFVKLITSSPLENVDPYYFKWTLNNCLLFSSNNENQLTLYNPLTQTVTYGACHVQEADTITAVTEGDGGSIFCLTKQGNLNIGYFNQIIPLLEQSSLTQEQLDRALTEVKIIIPLAVISLMLDYVGKYDYMKFPFFLASQWIAAQFQPPARLSIASQAELKRCRAQLKYQIDIEEKQEEKSNETEKLNELDTLTAELNQHTQKSVQECVTAVLAKRQKPANFYRFYREKKPLELHQLYLALKDAPICTFEEDELTEIVIKEIAPATYPRELQKKLNRFFTQLDCSITLGAKPDLKKINQRNGLLNIIALQTAHPEWNGKKCLQELYKRKEYADLQHASGELGEILNEIELQKSPDNQPEEQKALSPAMINEHFSTIYLVLEKITRKTAAIDEMEAHYSLISLTTQIKIMDPKEQSTETLQKIKDKIEAIHKKLPNDSVMAPELQALFSPTQRRNSPR